MNPNFIVKTAPFSGSFIKELAIVYKSAFPMINLDSLHWRINNMPDVTIFIALVDDNIAGFKAGYAATETRYYSWLGGVDPIHRNKGIATQLMVNQHNWLITTNYKIVETHVNQSNRVMIQLNHNSGLLVTGYFMKRSKPNFIMQKGVNETKSY